MKYFPPQVLKSMGLGSCTMFYPATGYMTGEQCQCDLMRNVLATFNLHSLAAVFNKSHIPQSLQNSLCIVPSVVALSSL